MNSKGIIFILIILVMITTLLAEGEPSEVKSSKVKPYILINNEAGTVLEEVKKAKIAILENGFEVVGEYEPFADRYVIVFTNEQLKQDAAKTDFGAYGAALRIGFALVDSMVQVAYTDPVYWHNAYRMESDVETLTNQLVSTFGEGEPFGSKKGEKIKKLRKYHYMMSMPYFDDPYELAEHASYEEAVKAVEAGLAANKGGTSKIYRIDIPGKNETVFGVGMTTDTSSDEVIMRKIDRADLKHTPYLCYEMVVSENKVYTLNGKFRIAISFPDLSMRQFTKIINAPGDIKAALRAAASLDEE